MGQKYEWKTRQQVESTAASLKDALESLTTVHAKMLAAQMDKALFPWTQRQWDSLDVIVTLAAQCVLVIQSQVIAKEQNRPSQYEMIKQRSARTVERRAERQAESKAAAAPKKPRGRPKKKA